MLALARSLGSFSTISKKVAMPESRLSATFESKQLPQLRAKVFPSESLLAMASV